MRSKLMGAACALALGLWSANGQAATLVASQSGETTGDMLGGQGLGTPGDYELVLHTSQTVTAILSFQGDVTTTFYCPGTTDICQEAIDQFGGNIQQTGTDFTYDQTLSRNAVIGDETLVFDDTNATFEIITDSTTPYTYDFDIYLLAVPEPKAWALALLGIFGVGALIRRRRNLSPTSALA